MELWVTSGKKKTRDFQAGKMHYDSKASYLFGNVHTEVIGQIAYLNPENESLS